MSIIEKIKLVPLPENQYFNEDAVKKQIYVHHTASSSSPFGVIDWWKQTPDKIAVAYIIGGNPGLSTKWKDGDVIQCFGGSKWAWHLGLKAEHLAKGGPKAQTNTQLNKQSIGIEICNWGQLTKTPQGFKNYAGGVVPDDQVIELNTVFRGFKYYHGYTPAQLGSLKELLQYLCAKYEIPSAYVGDKIFDICPEALQGVPSIYSHVSVRGDKNDCSPQPALIQVLNSL